MNEEQAKAIKSINRAMKRAGDVGLSFAGVDTELIVFDDEEYRSIAKMNDAYQFERSPGEVVNNLDYDVIKCNYVDSCAT